MRCLEDQFFIAIFWLCAIPAVMEKTVVKDSSADIFEGESLQTDPNTLLNAARRVHCEQLQKGFEEGAFEICRTLGVFRRQAQFVAEDLRGVARDSEFGGLRAEAAQLVDDRGQLPPHSLRAVRQSGSVRNHTCRLDQHQ